MIEDAQGMQSVTAENRQLLVVTGAPQPSSALRMDLRGAG